MYLCLCAFMSVCVSVCLYACLCIMSQTDRHIGVKGYAREVIMTVTADETKASSCKVGMHSAVW